MLYEYQTLHAKKRFLELVCMYVTSSIQYEELIPFSVSKLQVLGLIVVPVVYWLFGLMDLHLLHIEYLVNVIGCGIIFFFTVSGASVLLSFT